MTVTIDTSSDLAYQGWHAVHPHSLINNARAHTHTRTLIGHAFARKYVAQLCQGCFWCHVTTSNDANCKEDLARTVCIGNKPAAACC